MYEPAIQTCNLSLRLVRRNVWLQPADGREVPRVCVLGVKSLRHPELHVFGTAAAFGRIGKIKVGRHDPNYRSGNVIELDRLPDDPGVSSKLTLPQTVAQNRDLIFARCVFLPRKSSSE